jgi:hypothetical protein
MMRQGFARGYYVLLTFCVGMLAISGLTFSCKKRVEDTKSTTPNFTVKGLRNVDLSLLSSGKDTFTISVSPLIAGITDTVFLYANDVPGDVFVEFAPLDGVTPFTSRVSVSALYKPGGGTYNIKINAAGHTGLFTQAINVTLPAFKGWQLGSIIYVK